MDHMKSTVTNGTTGSRTRTASNQALHEVWHWKRPEVVGTFTSSLEHQDAKGTKDQL
jgi:hypothetical protein